MPFDFELRSFIDCNTDGYTKALVSFRVGPLIVRNAKIFEKEGKRWLSMPGRRTPQGSWMDTAFFVSREDKLMVEQAVLEHYDKYLLEQASTDQANPELTTV